MLEKMQYEAVRNYWLNQFNEIEVPDSVIMYVPMPHEVKPTKKDIEIGRKLAEKYARTSGKTQPSKKGVVY
jgi:hypothetical protein